MCLSRCWRLAGLKSIYCRRPGLGHGRRRRGGRCDKIRLCDSGWAFGPAFSEHRLFRL
ncbi:hypothetical protein Agau_C101352 [Agrobacterium tumefaciens F2]|nr:hypothetical protein Agau_C101352 [Agrobacterium tumefaciens F2]